MAVKLLSKTIRVMCAVMWTLSSACLISSLKSLPSVVNNIWQFSCLSSTKSFPPVTKVKPDMSKV